LGEKSILKGFAIEIREGHRAKGLEKIEILRHYTPCCMRYVINLKSPLYRDEYGFERGFESDPTEDRRKGL
jgi:hypothetical protein